MKALLDSDPRRIGSYRLHGRLGVDAMGPVLLGTAPDRRLVAVKTVSSRLAIGDGVAALRQVAGHQVARVVDAAPTEALPWVAAEFVPGVSLSRVVERGVRLAEDDLLRLAAGLVGALTELQRVGQVHRDLTPVNVWLVDDGVRVFDFGVEHGAPDFVAPEQVGGSVTSAGNVFTFGVLLYLAFTGRGSVDGAQLSTAFPPRTRYLLTACLARDPRQRPTLDQLRALLGPPVAHPWPAQPQSMIDEQRAEVTALSRVGRAAPARRKPEPKRWRPDTWAVVSGAAIVLTIVFAIVMFNALAPDEPVSAPTPTETVETTTVPTTTTTTTTTTTEPPPPPYGEITGLAGKCVDVAGAGTGDGTPVQLHECNGTDAQEWEFLPDGTLQALGKCLDVTGGHTDDGTTVQLYDCNGTGAQQWAVGADGSIVNGKSGKCLDVPGKATEDGTQLIIWTCHGQENQRWTPPA